MNNSQDIYDSKEISKKMLKRANENYFNLIKRNNSNLWEKYFQDMHFVYLRTNKEFTISFLEFITDNHNFKLGIWNSVFLKTLTNWKRYWPELDMSALFDKALNSYTECKDTSSKKYNTNYGGALRPKYLIIFLLFLVGFSVLIINVEGALPVILLLPILPVFLLSDIIPEPAFTYIAFIWIALIIALLFFAVWGLLYCFQNGFNKKSLKSFFYTIRKLLFAMLIGILLALITSFTQFSIDSLLFFRLFG